LLSHALPTASVHVFFGGDVTFQQVQCDGVGTRLRSLRLTPGCSKPR
jgi:hypothetical protein